MTQGYFFNCLVYDISTLGGLFNAIVNFSNNYMASKNWTYNNNNNNNNDNNNCGPSVPGDHWIKLKECEQNEKYIDFSMELKQVSNIKVTIIPIVIGALGTVTKKLVQGLND